MRGKKCTFIILIIFFSCNGLFVTKAPTEMKIVTSNTQMYQNIIQYSLVCVYHRII